MVRSTTIAHTTDTRHPENDRGRLGNGVFGVAEPEGGAVLGDGKAVLEQGGAAVGAPGVQRPGGFGGEVAWPPLVDRALVVGVRPRGAAAPPVAAVLGPVGHARQAEAHGER